MICEVRSFMLETGQLGRSQISALPRNLILIFVPLQLPSNVAQDFSLGYKCILSAMLYQISSGSGFGGCISEDIESRIFYMALGTSATSCWDEKPRRGWSTCCRESFLRSKPLLEEANITTKG